MIYEKSTKYPDLATTYSECSGPGGLKLAEFLAEKMHIQSGARLLDVGTARGYQTCFLAKEYKVSVVGIDPCDDREDHIPNVEHLMDNAYKWGVQDRVIGVRVGVPDTKFPSNAFDFVYSTTTLEMIRGIRGAKSYRQCLTEIFRVLRPGGIFGLAEPMHLPKQMPPDLAPIYTKGHGVGVEGWATCFVTLAETVSECMTVDFKVLDSGLAPDALLWWEEFSKYDPYCMADPEGEARVIQQDGGRWLTLGYVILQKPD